MPCIILEGADGAGKSTLAAELREAWGGPSKLWRQGPPARDASIRDVYEAPFHSYAASRTSLLVCDRWHLGELVYGPMLRGESRLTLVERFHLELYLAGLGALLVHVQVPETELKNRLRVRGDELVTTEQALEAAARYRALLASTQLPTVTATSPVAYPALKSLLGQARSLAEGARGAAAGLYLGPVHTGPDLLLVGDRPGAGGLLQPPFPPYSARGCSRWFVEVCYQLGQHRTLGLVNAHSVSAQQLTNLASQRGTRVVALGGEAARRLDDLGLKHGTTNHPQWWKRFRHHDQEGYQTALLRAAATSGDWTRSA